LPNYSFNTNALRARRRDETGTDDERRKQEEAVTEP
jgi:hypothetical protein